MLILETVITAVADFRLVDPQTIHQLGECLQLNCFAEMPTQSHMRTTTTTTTTTAPVASSHWEENDLQHKRIHRIHRHLLHPCDANGARNLVRIWKRNKHQMTIRQHFSLGTIPSSHVSSKRSSVMLFPQTLFWVHVALQPLPSSVVFASSQSSSAPWTSPSPQVGPCSASSMLQSALHRVQLAVP